MNNSLFGSIFLIILCLAIFFSIFNSEIFAERIQQVNVSKNPGKSDLAQLLAVDNNVYIVWKDNSVGNEEIFFAKSSDSGKGFDNSLNLSNNNGTSAFPRMSVIGKNIYVTWYDYTPGQSDIFFAKSFDGGNSFETVNLSNNGGVSYNPWVAASDNNVFVVWNDETPQLANLKITKPENVDVTLGTLDILLAKSNDGGSTFDFLNLSDTQENSWNPRITVYENNVYVVWNEKIESNYEIFFASSTDGGKSFSKPTNLSSTANLSQDAGIEAFGNYVYVIWQETSTGSVDIFFTKSDNKGISFSEPIKISNDGTSEITRDTQMVVLENNVYVVWFDKSTANGVFFVKSEDNGRTFSTPINLSGELPDVQMAQIAAFEDRLYVIWQDSSLGNSEVFLRKSHDKGQSFGSIVNISKDDSESHLFILGPQIFAENQNVYTVFEKMGEGGSDLFLYVMEEDYLQNGTLGLQTIDGAVNVEIGIDKEKLEPETPLTFNLKFLDPVTGQLLKNVNYSFIMEDVDGYPIMNNQNQLAPDGHDFQTVKFTKLGPVRIIIDIKGLGGEPHDTTYVGSVSAILSVIPEFPSGAIITMVIFLSLVTLIGKFRFFKNLHT